MAAENRFRILVVDDNTSIHEDIRKILLPARIDAQRERSRLEEEVFGNALMEPADTSLPYTYEIDDAYQGEEAVEKVRTATASGAPYSLVFMDVRMPPGIDGICAARRIWAEFPDTEIVIITAYSDYSWGEILTQLGTSDHLLFIRKPFDGVSIKQTALAMCTKWRFDRHNRELIRDLEEKVQERTKELNCLLRQRENHIKKIQEELDFAQSVQIHLLPHSIPEVPRIDIATRYFPAEKVGGDFYDFMTVDEKTMAVLILDVAGHGLAAALLTAIAKMAFTNHLKPNRSPAQVMDMVNRDLQGYLPECIFITAFLMYIDTETGQCRFCNAGHIPPLLHRSGNQVIEELRSGGVFLGVLPDLVYQEESLNLDPGDRVILYTDGLIEACDSKGKRFSRDRLRTTLTGLPPLPAVEIIDCLLKENQEFREGTPWQDDVCILSLVVR